MGREEYEISIWKDEYNSILGRYAETKMAIIGSHLLDAEMHAFEPKLVENINGTNTFSFKMFRNCKDQVTGKNYMNPFILDLVNERKIKVKWRGKWYDFILKNAHESSDKNIIEYSCSDAYINELSKTGFNLQFDIELQNNQGTAEELAARVVDGTEWRALNAEKYALKVQDNKVIEDSFRLSSDQVHPEVIVQEKEEPVYEILSTSTALTGCKNDTTGEEGVEIPVSSFVLWFYPQMSELYQLATSDAPQTSGARQFQFAYTSDESYNILDGSQLVDNADCYTSPVLNWSYVNGEFTITFNNSVLCSFYFSDVSKKYRAKRRVRSQLGTMDTVTGKYCTIFTDTTNNHDIYSYIDTKVESAVAVVNVVANPCNYGDTTGWEIEDPKYKLCPDPSTIGEGEGYTSIDDYTAVSCLRLNGGTSNFNEGLKSCASYLHEGLQKGSKYVFRYKIHEETNARPAEQISINGSTIGFDIGTINSSGTYKVIGTSIVNAGSDIVETDSQGNNTGWHYRIVTFIDSRSYNDLVANETESITTRNVGMFLTPTANVWAEEIQFFKYIKNEAGAGSGNRDFIVPGNFASLSPVQIQYNYYDYSVYGAGTKEDVRFIYQGNTDINLSSYNLIPKLNENYEKIRSITERQSNRFNLIQSIAEQFDCWAYFYIGHNDDGSIIYGSDGLPYKFVYFTNNLGQDTGIGFVYGIDLKEIQRTIQSDNIVTKTIVLPNNNQFAMYGSCDISRSESNYSKSTSIYNFDYYLSHGLIDGTQLNNDLYGTGTSTYARGYYTTLHEEYGKYDYYTELIVKLLNEETKLRSYATLYDSTIKSCDKLITSYKARILNAAGYPKDLDSLASANQYFMYHTVSDSIKELLTSWRTTESKRAEAVSNLADCQTGLATIEDKLNNPVSGYTIMQKAALAVVENAEMNFFKKYSRFIQEGSWQNDDYIDDSLYYFDGVALAYRSSRPQVNYNISIMRISALEEFKYKVFKLGDITYVQDEEFFGLVDIDGYKTPYKERVVISEMVSNFDEPEKDSFTVQNYKTGLDDLFQRITATTQSLEFHEGSYARAANVVMATGTISPTALQATLNENKQLTMAAVNDTVVQDSNGITLSSADDPSRKVRINSNGMFMTTDGGDSWVNAVRSNGVATEALSAGALDITQIAIYNGDLPTFRWDQYGISAFNYVYADGHDGDPNYLLVNDRKWVRFDRFGLYGVNGISSAWVPGSEESVWSNAQFGLTWSGFFLKTNHTSSAMWGGTFQTGYIDLSDETSAGSGEYSTFDIVTEEDGEPVTTSGIKGDLSTLAYLSVYTPIVVSNIASKAVMINVCVRKAILGGYIYKWLYRNLEVPVGQAVSIAPDPDNPDFNQCIIDYYIKDGSDVTINALGESEDIEAYLTSSIGSIEISSSNDIGVSIIDNGIKRNLIKIGWIEGGTYEGIANDTVGMIINKVVNNNLVPVFKMTSDGVLIIGDFTINQDSFTYLRRKVYPMNSYWFRVSMAPEGFTAAYYPLVTGSLAPSSDNTNIRGMMTHFGERGVDTQAVSYIQFDTNLFVGGYQDFTWISTDPQIMSETGYQDAGTLPLKNQDRGIFAQILPSNDSSLIDPITQKSVGNGNYTAFSLRYFESEAVGGLTAFNSINNLFTSMGNRLRSAQYYNDNYIIYQELKLGMRNATLPATGRPEFGLSARSNLYRGSVGTTMDSYYYASKYCQGPGTYSSAILSSSDSVGAWKSGDISTASAYLKPTNYKGISARITDSQPQAAPVQSIKIIRSDSDNTNSGVLVFVYLYENSRTTLRVRQYFPPADRVFGITLPPRETTTGTVYWYVQCVYVTPYGINDYKFYSNNGVGYDTLKVKAYTAKWTGEQEVGALYLDGEYLNAEGNWDFTNSYLKIATNQTTSMTEGDHWLVWRVNSSGEGHWYLE